MEKKAEEQLRLHFEQINKQQELFMQISQIIINLNWTDNKKDLNLFIMSTLKRSVSTMEGIKVLIEAKNFTCAAPLTRVFIDTLIRLHAFTLVENPIELASEVLSGKKIKDIRDKIGKQMFYRYLVESLSREYSWIKNVYEQTSGHIHLSHIHCFDMIADQVEDENSIVTKYYMGKKDIHVSKGSWLEITTVVIETSNALSKTIRLLLKDDFNKMMD